MKKETGKMKLPEDVVHILKRLQEAGFPAYVVGGCVRDWMMGNKPHDYDVATAANPETVEKIFADCQIVETGLKHGTVTVLMNGVGYEITTFRTEGDYEDGRHPGTVSFVKEIEEDLARRDFTINAIAYDGKEMVDPFQGEEDIKNGVLRCVGEPTERFSEDALRILRAMRFAARYKMKTEQKTRAAMHDMRERLDNISRERVADELKKILVFADYAFLIENKDIFFQIIPELTPLDRLQQNNPHHDRDVWRHTALAVSEAPRDAVIRLVMLFHDIGKQSTYSEDKEGIGHFLRHPEVSAVMTEDILKKLRFSNKEIEDICILVKYHDVHLCTSVSFARKWKAKMGEENIGRMLDVMEADRRAQVLTEDALKLFESVKTIRKNLEQVAREEQLLTVRDLKVNGNDLMELGLRGPAIGQMKQRLLELVMEEPEKNERESLLKMAKGEMKNG